MKPEEAIKRIKNLIKGREDPRGKTELDFALDMAIEALKEQKQKENGVERPHGEWVLDQEFSFVFNMYECSKCRFNGSKRWHFCPNCGSDNRKRGEEK